MAERYSDRIRRYCQQHGISIPIGFGRHSASRYVVVELSEQPKLVARTWFNVADLIHYLDRASDVPRQILDFKEGVVLERTGATRVRAVAPLGPE